ncbi:MAG TPA: lytic transglycosylase domain-containing protein [Vampirovibrionales bacterium]
MNNKSFGYASILGLVLLTGAVQESQAFDLGSFIDRKADELIASRVRRIGEKASNKVNNLTDKFTNNDSYEEPAKSSYYSYNPTYKSKYGVQSQQNNTQAYAAQNNSGVYLSPNSYNTSQSHYPQVAPAISPPQSSPQMEEQIDEMVLAKWSQPSSVSTSDWRQILLSTKKASERTGIPQQLIMSLINKESSFNPYAVSRSGAKGLTQLMPTTAYYECGVSENELFDIDTNITCGVSYLDKQLNQFKRLDLAIAAYNAGPGAVRRAIEKSGSDNIHIVTAHLKPETAPYVSKILASINYGSDFI